jgi:hypothetical protein
MHPLYFDAHSRFLRNRSIQFDKAAAKYPEPLNPDNWTVDQLADHAAQEMVDLLHYLEAIKEKADKAVKKSDKPMELLNKIETRLTEVFKVEASEFPEDYEEAVADVLQWFSEYFPWNKTKGGD